MTELTALPLCKDCKHSFGLEKQGISGPYAEQYCCHPIVGTHVNPVSGRGRAAIARNDEKLCGKAGRYWE